MAFINIVISLFKAKQDLYHTVICTPEERSFHTNIKNKKIGPEILAFKQTNKLLHFIVLV